MPVEKIHLAVLQIFRNNQSSTAFFLLAYVILVRLPAILGIAKMPEKGFPDGGVLSQWICNTLADKPLWSAAMAAGLIFLQGIFLTNLDNRFRLAADRTWVLALWFVLTASVFPEFLFTSPALLGLTFLPIVFSKIFSSYKQQLAAGGIFDAAFWLSVGGLFYPPMLWLLVAAYVGFLILRSFNLKEQVVFMTGVLVPIFLAWAWCFWNDRSPEFWSLQFGGLLNLFDLRFDFSVKTLVHSSLYLLLLLVVLTGFGTYYHKKLIQVQKYISILYWFLFVAALCLALRPTMQLEYLLLLTPVIGIFLGLTFLSLRNRMLAELWHLALLAAVLFLHFFPF